MRREDSGAASALRERWRGRDGGGKGEINLQSLLSSHARCLSLPPAVLYHQNKHFVKQRKYNHE